MGQIIAVELKKALLSRKNWVLTLLYIGVLLIFAAANMNEFERIRLEEAAALEIMVNGTMVNSQRWMRLSETETMSSGTVVRCPELRQTEAVLGRLNTELSVVVAALSNAIIDNDRGAEFEHYLEMRRLIYSYYSMYMAEYRPHPQRLREYVSDNEIVYYWGLMFEFAQKLADNDIQFLYESEMKGFNFLYQAMRTLLPLVLLFFAFLTICDVFAFDNEAGSYKLLLSQPFPRARIYFTKVTASFVILLSQLLAVLLLSFLILSLVNGFGSPNYPVLMQSGTYTAVTPTPNYGHLAGLDMREVLNMFRHRGFANYPLDAVRLGVSRFYPSDTRILTDYLPHYSLNLYWMTAIILSALPIYAVLLLFIAALSALVSVLSQSGIVTVAVGVVLSIAPLLFTMPQSNIPFWQRLNPLLYIHAISVLGGMGSTTALTGLLTLTVFSGILLLIGVLVFKKKDIRC